MEWYEAEVGDLEASLKSTPPPEHCAAFYGSSSIRMWVDLAGDLADRRAVNVGFGGSTLAACVHFFDRLIPPLRPASMVIYAGDNDLGDGRRPEEVCQSSRGLTTRIEKSLGSIPLSFISSKISPARYALRDRIVKTNDLIARELGKIWGATYIDVSRAMLDMTGQPRLEFFLSDGLHLSREGYLLWTELHQPYRNQIFTPLSSKNDTRSATLEP